MFTGIVEEVGKVKKLTLNGHSGKIEIEAKKVLEDAHLGDSIAVNGVCLTVTKISGNSFEADVMAETVRRTSLNGMTGGSLVNLERAMAANGRFGGHIVSGHVDTTGVILDITREENAIWYTIKVPSKELSQIAEKGSIALDGISLTVAFVGDTCFRVSVIPHTAANTTLSHKRSGDVINVETDVLAKYISRMLSFNNENETEKSEPSCITMEFLKENGF